MVSTMVAETEHLIGFYDKPSGGKLHWKTKNYRFHEHRREYVEKGELQELYDQAVELWRRMLRWT